MELNHLHLNVADMNRSAAFYERWFGFRRHRVLDDGALLFLRNANDLDLALSNEGEDRSLPKWFHFGFRLGSAAEVKALHASMKSAGVAVRNIYEEEGFATYRLQDRDGYAIEVYWE
jgi:catechol 2,3-dioxygenase-like lactoylglutathione lyase family enzyme